MAMERTLVLIKPDGVKRGLIGEIIKRFEQRGLKIVAIKMVKPQEETAGRHYIDDMDWLKSVGEKSKKSFEQRGIKVKETPEEIGRRIRNLLMGYLSSSPVVAMVIAGPGAVSGVRKIVGPTEPKSAPPGTIRGDFSVDSYELGDEMHRPVKNLIHASDSKETAEKEIDIWFSENEIFDFELAGMKQAYEKDW